MVNNLSTQNLGQMKVRHLAGIKYFQEEMGFFFCFDLLWSLTKLKIAVFHLSKPVNSANEEILSLLPWKVGKNAFLKQ